MQEKLFEDTPQENKPDGSGPHGRGLGPGKGQADGSGMEKKDEQNLNEETKKEEKKEERQTKETKEKEVDLKELKGVEIFAVGTHNGDKYTEKDLEQMVASFNQIGEQIKPHLKIGHSDKQTLLAADEIPAAGWMTNLYKKGEKLVADFKDVPQKIYNLIKNKAYKRISSEIYWNFKHKDGKIYPRVMRACALLGGATPAVTNLADIEALYGNLEPIKAYKADNQDLRIYEWEENEMEEIKKYESKIAKLEEEKKALENKAKESDEKAKKYEMEIKKAERETKELNVEIKLDEWIKDKKILPAQRDYTFSLLTNMDKEEIEIGEKKFTREGLVEEIIKLNKLDINSEEKTEHTENNKENEESLDSKALKYAEENNVSYKQALLEITKED